MIVSTGVTVGGGDGDDGDDGGDGGGCGHSFGDSNAPRVDYHSNLDRSPYPAALACYSHSPANDCPKRPPASLAAYRCH